MKKIYILIYGLVCFRGEGGGGRKGGRIFIYLMSVSMAVETMA